MQLSTFFHKMKQHLMSDLLPNFHYHYNQLLCKIIFLINRRRIKLMYNLIPIIIKNLNLGFNRITSSFELNLDIVHVFHHSNKIQFYVFCNCIPFKYSNHSLFSLQIGRRHHGTMIKTHRSLKRLPMKHWHTSTHLQILSMPRKPTSNCYEHTIHLLLSYIMFLNIYFLQVKHYFSYLDEYNQIVLFDACTFKFNVFIDQICSSLSKNVPFIFFET